MEKYISREKRDNLHRNLKNVEKFVGVEVCLSFRKGGGCNRFRGDRKKKMRREEGMEKMSSSLPKTKRDGKVWNCGARESHAEGRSREIRGKEACKGVGEG